MISKGHDSLTNNDYYEEWAEFQSQARSLVTKANGDQSLPGIIWTSALTDPSVIENYLNKFRYIIQIWTSKDDPVVGIAECLFIYS